jgi:hypothetical protein
MIVTQQLFLDAEYGADRRSDFMTDGRNCLIFCFLKCIQIPLILLGKLCPMLIPNK